MFNRALTILIYFIFLCPSIIFSQIYSTQSGGPWWEPSTWQNSVVPGPGDDAVIEGPVQLGLITNVKDITVQQNGKLESAYPINDVTFYIAGDIYNYGRIDGKRIEIHVEGNIVNNGYWVSYRVYLSDNIIHYLESYYGSKFSPAAIWADNATISSSGNIYLDSVAVRAGHFNLGNNDPVFPRDTLFLDNASELYVDTLMGNNSYIRLENNSSIRYYLFNKSFSSVYYDVSLLGNIIIEDMTLYGEINLLGTMVPVQSGIYIRVYGNIYNYGEVKSNSSGDLIGFQLYGNLENNGLWNAWYTELNGITDQHVGLNGSNSSLSSLYMSTNIFGNSYQWFYNGTPIPGATSSLLILNDVNTSSFGVYHCESDTGGGTIYSRNITIGSGTTVIEEAKKQVPVDIVLFQNYPNPFNPETIIKYSLPESALVQIKIYDISGKEIANLVDEYKQAGTYEIKFNGRDISSGVYFYSINSGNNIISKKMVLLK